MPDNIDVTSYIAQQWKAKAGIKTSDVVATEQSKYITDVLLAGNFMATGLRGYSGRDPETNNVFWNSLTYAPSGTTTLNIQRLRNPIIDEALKQLRTNDDPVLRKRFAKAISTEFNDNCYNIWLYQTTWGIGAQKNITGFESYTLPSGSQSTKMVAGYTWAGNFQKS